MGKKILVIAAHPDDEVLGCGATIARHVKTCDEVHVVILAEGVTSRDERRDVKSRKPELSELSSSAHNANKILGVKSLTLHNFPDNRLDSLDRLDVIKVVERFIDKYRPEMVYTHHIGDVNVDHKVVHEAVVTACRPMPLQPVKTILFFETPSSTEWQTPGSSAWFMPNWFVDVSATIDAKLQALDAYRSEMRPHPHVRSIEAILNLAQWRGAIIGTKAAEAFVLGRNIV